MVDEDTKRCIDDRLDCWRTCHQTINGPGLEMGGEHVGPEHVRRMVDRAEIRRTSADPMMRRSPRHHLACATCADICGQCAEECARFGDDDRLRTCAAARRRCARSCEQMSAAATR